MWLGFALRVGVAFLNAYHGPIVGGGGDATGFHQVAVEFSQTLRPNQVHFGLVYAWGLGLLYHVTHPSLFLGGVFSALAWLASGYVLFHIMRLLEFRGPQRIVVMCVYTLYPSSILLTGVTLREAYQLLSVNLAVYGALKVCLHGRMRYWLVIFAAVLFGGVLQAGILLFGGLVLAATATWLLIQKRHRIGGTRLALAVAFAAVLIGLVALLFSRAYNYGLGVGIAEAIETYQRGGLSIPARTHFKTEVDINGFGDLVGFVLAGLFQYLFEPMPWRPLMLIDIPTVFENLLRAALIGSTLVALVVTRSSRRAPLALMFMAYVALELLFSVGTVNWGTAARHHVPSLGLLVVCGFTRWPRRRGQRADAAGTPSEQVLHAGASA